MICSKCGGRKYRRNAIHETRLKDALSHAISLTITLQQGIETQRQARRYNAAKQRAIKLLSRVTAEDLETLTDILLSLEESIVDDAEAQKKLNDILKEADSPASPAHQLFGIFLEEDPDGPGWSGEEEEDYDARNCLKLLKSFVERENMTPQATADELDVSVETINSWLDQDLGAIYIETPNQEDCGMILDLLGLPY